MAAPSALADDHPLGSAFAVSVEATLLNAVKAKVGPLAKATYPAGDDESVVTIDSHNDLVLQAKLLNGSSLLDGDTLTSSASITDVNVLGLITAKLISAECVADDNGAQGTAQLVDVTVAGQKIEIEGDELGTQEIKVGNEVIVRINEQIRENGMLTVNALHVIVGGAVNGVAEADVILSQAVCPASDGGEPTSTTEPTETETETTEPTSTETETTTTGTEPTSTTAPSPTQPGGPGNGDDGDLPETGVSAVVPLAIGGLLLLGGGGAALWYARRRRSTEES